MFTIYLKCIIIYYFTNEKYFELPLKYFGFFFLITLVALHKSLFCFIILALYSLRSRKENSE